MIPTVGIVDADGNPMHRPDEFLAWVLQGHLGIEGVLEFLIERYATSPEHLLGGNLGFAAKLRAVRSLVPHSADHQLWEAVVALNRLRNQMAHLNDSKSRRKAFDNMTKRAKESGLEFGFEYRENQTAAGKAYEWVVELQRGLLELYLEPEELYGPPDEEG